MKFWSDASKGRWFTGDRCRFWNRDGDHPLCRKYGGDYGFDLVTAFLRGRPVVGLAVLPIEEIAGNEGAPQRIWNWYHVCARIGDADEQSMYQQVEIERWKCSSEWREEDTSKLKFLLMAFL